MVFVCQLHSCGFGDIPTAKDLSSGCWEDAAYTEFVITTVWLCWKFKYRTQHRMNNASSQSAPNT